MARDLNEQADRALREGTSRVRRGQPPNPSDEDLFPDIFGNNENTNPNTNQDVSNNSNQSQSNNTQEVIDHGNISDILQAPLNRRRQQQQREQEQQNQQDQNNNQNNNPNNNQNEPPPGFLASLLNNHGDAIIAGVIGMMAGKAWGNRRQSQTGDVQGGNPSQGGSNRLGCFGVIAISISSAIMIFILLFVGLLNVRLYQQGSEGLGAYSDGLVYFISKLTGSTPEGTDFIDPEIKELKDENTYEQLETVRYEVRDGITYLKFDEFTVYSVDNFKPKTRTGSCLVRVKRSSIDQSLVDYKVEEKDNE